MSVHSVPLLYMTSYISYHGDPRHLDITFVKGRLYGVFDVTLVDNSGFCGVININLMFRMDLVACWSGSTSTSAAIQWFDVSCSILSFLFDILKISGISTKLVTFVTVYMTFFEILEKANQHSNVLTFKWTNLHYMNQLL